MTKDTQDEPVTVEEEIASLMQAAEDKEDDESSEPDSEPESSEEVESEQEESPEKDDDVSEGVDDDDAGEDEQEGEIAEQVSDDQGEDDEDISEQETDPLEPPEHWAAADKERFNSVPREAQEFLLDRHKAMEGDYTRKRQQESSQVRLAESVADALEPYRSEFERAGLDHAGAVRQLAHWHSALKTSPKEAIQELAKTYGVDLSEPDSDENLDPAFRSIQQELGSLKQTLTRQEQLAQQQELDRINQEIQSFAKQTDAEGQLIHTHFDALQDDMAALMNSGVTPKGDLDKAYQKALLLHPELAAPKPKPVVKTKEDPAEKVKRAKRAATTVKSSGAVGKKERDKLTLEEEIASHFS